MSNFHLGSTHTFTARKRTGTITLQAGAGESLELTGAVNIVDSASESAGITVNGLPLSGSGVSLELNELNDVSLTSPATDDVLQYNGSSWINNGLALGSLAMFQFRDQVPTMS